jgi:hypothetical protein
VSSKKKQTIGHRYFFGLHKIYCKAPIDHVRKIFVDEKIAIEGQFVDEQVYIDKPNLFGGKKSEGGIQGYVDIEMGGPAQGQNDYLVSKLNQDSASSSIAAAVLKLFSIDIGSATATQINTAKAALIPSFRGVFGLVLRGVYVGTSTYLKNWAVEAQRIHVRQDGIAQWYDSKAEVPGESGAIISTWNVDTLTADGDTINLGYADNNFSGVMSIDGLHIVAAVNMGSFDRRIVSFTLSTAYEVATAVEDAGFAAITNASHSGSFLLSGGAKYYMHARATGIQEYTLSTPYLGSTATLSYTLTPSSARRWGIFISEDERNLFICDNPTGQCAIRLYKMSTPGVLSTAVDSGSFVIPGEVNEGITITGNPDASILFVGVITSGRIYTVTLSDPSNIGTASVASFSSVSVSPETEMFATRSGAYFYKLTAPSTITRFTFEQIVQSGYMNPAHIIRESLTDPDWGLGYLDADIDDTAFMSAADTLYDEGFGLCFLWTQESSIEDFISDVRKHINAAVYLNRSTGKFVLKLIRNDYDIGTLLTLNEFNIIKIDGIKTRQPGDLITEVAVTFRDVATDKDSTVYAQNSALEISQNRYEPAAISYPGIPVYTIADKVAARDLMALSLPVTSCTIYATREAFYLNIGDVFILDLPTHNISEMVMRVTAMDFGSPADPQIKITASQDVFSFGDISLSSVDDTNWSNPSKAPLPATDRLVFEAPYYILARDLGDTAIDVALANNEYLGYMLATASRPASEIDMELWVDSGSGYVSSGISEFSPYGELSGNMGYLTDTIVLTSPIDLGQIAIGSMAYIGSEIVRVDSVDLVTYAVTIGRGVLDTVPVEHTLGESVFFWSDYSTDDGIEYNSTETINIKQLPKNGLGVINIVDAVEDELTFAQRAILPFAPGNVLINTEAYPGYLDEVSTIDITWSHRDRQLQTSTTIYDTTFGNIGPEAGTTYAGSLKRVDTGATLDSFSGETGVSSNLDPSGYEGEVLVTLYSQRDGYDSWQSHEIQLFITPNVVMLYEDGSPMQFENGDFMTYERE